MNRRTLLKRLAGFLGLAVAPGLLTRVMRDEPPDVPTGTLTIHPAEWISEPADEFLLWDEFPASPSGWSCSAKISHRPHTMTSTTDDLRFALIDHGLIKP